MQLSEEEMNKIIEEDRLRFEELQKKAKQKKSGQPAGRKGIAGGKKMPGRSKSMTKVGGSGSASGKAMPLSVDRRKKQDLMLAQQSDSGSRDTRRNLDKRTARIRHSPHFIAAIKEYRNKNPHLNSNHNHREKR